MIGVGNLLSTERDAGGFRGSDPHDRREGVAPPEPASHAQLQRAPSAVDLALVLCGCFRDRGACVGANVGAIAGDTASTHAGPVMHPRRSFTRAESKSKRSVIRVPTRGAEAWSTAADA